MVSDFERLIIAQIDSAADNEELCESEYRLVRLLLERWEQRGLVEMARLIVVMDEWKSKGASK